MNENFKSIIEKAWDDRSILHTTDVKEAINAIIDQLDKGELSRNIESVERDHILKVLAEVNGNRTKAVEILGISARALRYKLKSYKEAGFLID